MTLAVSAVCFPADDMAFAGVVKSLVEPVTGEEVRATVETLLRATYPLARIAARHELAAVDGRRVWYCFRDGTARPASGEASPDGPPR